MVNQHTGISLILFDNTNREHCQGLELISFVLSQHAEFVGLAGALGWDSNELWTLRCSAHALRLKPPELRCSNNSNPCGFLRLWIKQKYFLANEATHRASLTPEQISIKLVQIFIPLQTNYISGSTSLIYWHMEPFLCTGHLGKLINLLCIFTAFCRVIPEVEAYKQL